MYVLDCTTRLVCHAVARVGAHPQALMQVIRVWARILEALPTARLLLKNKPFACESARAHTLGLLAAEVFHTLSSPSMQLLSIVGR